MRVPCENNCGRYAQYNERQVLSSCAGYRAWTRRGNKAADYDIGRCYRDQQNPDKVNPLGQRRFCTACRPHTPSSLNQWHGQLGPLSTALVSSSYTQTSLTSNAYDTYGHTYNDPFRRPSMTESTGSVSTTATGMGAMTNNVNARAAWGTQSAYPPNLGAFSHTGGSSYSTVSSRSGEDTSSLALLTNTALFVAGPHPRTPREHSQAETQSSYTATNDIESPNAQRRLFHMTYPSRSTQAGGMSYTDTMLNPSVEATSTQSYSPNFPRYETADDGPPRRVTRDNRDAEAEAEAGRQERRQRQREVDEEGATYGTESRRRKRHGP